MARICIEATPSDDLREYRFKIKRRKVRMNSSNQGCIDIEGQCGDGRPLRLVYGLVGDVGATLGIRMTCDDTHDIPMPQLEIFPPGPVQDGAVDFTL